jgi:hypothetical protein
MNESELYRVGELVHSRHAGYGIITSVYQHGATIYWFELKKYSPEAFHWVATFKKDLYNKLRGEEE